MFPRHANSVCNLDDTTSKMQTIASASCGTVPDMNLWGAFAESVFDTV